MTPKRRAQPRQAKLLQNTTVSRNLYEHIAELSRSLNEGQSPQAPRYYTPDRMKNANSQEYILAYEEELHLADHFAFLAHTEEDAKHVSAVALEERRDPPGLIVRLASNGKPPQSVVDGLERIIKLVETHAREGKHRDKYMNDLFDEVVRFSQNRIYARLRSSQWIRPHRINDKHSIPLHTNLSRFVALQDMSQLSSLVEPLNILIDTLKRVNHAPSDECVERLKNVIYRSHDVTTHEDSRSLESNLKKQHLGQHITESREVLEIDKLSNYIQLCKDLTRYSRQPRTRSLFSNIKLEVCPGCPDGQPSGASIKCHVHGEVQLVLHYEQYPTQPPPRAIGSSKSACFLCDLFIARHGVYGISHSHMRLHDKWMIPDSRWMEAAQAKRFEDIAQEMNLEILKLLKHKPYHNKLAVQSRVHLLLVEQASETASSVRSSEDPATPLSVRQDGNVSEDTIVPVLGPILENSVTSTLYYFQDLPISVDIVRTTISCTLLIGKVDYLFDFEDVEKGHFQVCEDTEAEIILNKGCVDVRGLDTISPTVLRCEDGTKISKLHVYDEGNYGLIITFTWIGVDGD